MPRRSILSASEREKLVALPENETDLIRYYTLSEQDLSVIGQHRGGHNRLGFAIQLCYLRHPGYALPTDATPPDVLLSFVSSQLRLSLNLWSQYALRAETRREHLLELQTWLKMTPFGAKHFRYFVEHLTSLAQKTDRGFVLATAFIESLHHQRIIVPGIDVVERVCAEALNRGTRQVYEALTTSLSAEQVKLLDGLLDIREGTNASSLAWLRQPPGTPNAKHIIAHIRRLRAINDLEFSSGLEHSVHQNRLLKLAREGNQMTAQHFRELETIRRRATLIAVVLEARATLIDEIVDMHDRVLGMLFNRAKRHHAEQFQESGKSINDKLQLYSRIGRAIIDARQNGTDPFAAIEAILSWDVFTDSVKEAGKLAQPEEFDYLPLVGRWFTQLRRYTPAMLAILRLKAAPAVIDILEGVNILRFMNLRQSRKVPDDAPTSFVRKRWKTLVHAEDGLDRRFYELCVMSELKNALRSGDMWIEGSRQFKDFEEYLVPKPRFAVQLESQDLGLAMNTDCDIFLKTRLGLLELELHKAENLAAQDALPDASITERGLRIIPLANAVPDEAGILARQVYALIPHLKITELLQEVDQWTGFTRHFTHVKSGATATDKSILLTTILADAINLGLVKMAESCPGTTYAKLSWLQAWHIRDETYSAALSELVNAQTNQSFAKWWGDGTTSSSDGQRFRAGGRGESAGQVNARYGNEPGVLFYTHISDQYSPFHTQVINSTARDATYVLDGLLYHESDLRIEEHYTDTAGFTDHVFALTQMLGFRFAPRIRDLSDKRLFIHGDTRNYPTLSTMIGGSINSKLIRAHWDEILRLASSIRQGTVTASLMMRKLGSYPRQNGLAVALRELGRVERSLFTLDWLQNVELRRRVQVGLNKGEAKNALARAVFFNRLGELRDRSFEDQRYRASGLNLVVAAIVLWNTIYQERAVIALRDKGLRIKEQLLQYLSPLNWEHINLTGDYIWKETGKVEKSKFRPLRVIEKP